MTDPTASAWPSEYVKRFVAHVLQDACELGDYTSPEETPELLQMTCSQLEGLVEGAFEALPADADLATTAREYEAAGDARVIAMREACVQWHEAEADAFDALADQLHSSLQTKLRRDAANRHRDYARDLRALPLPPTEALAAVVAEAVAKEREACALTAENFFLCDGDGIAKHIRARAARTDGSAG